MDLQSWTLAKLETVKDYPRVLVQDSLRLLPEADSMIHGFGRENGFAVIVASTNLVFRELYERASADSDTKKILLIDRAPIRRRIGQSLTKAPPPFYPDFLMQVPPEARIDLDLRQFLRETTGDPNWPVEANDPRYARLIAKHLDGVLRAHQNLSAARPGQFTDHDFKTIVAFAALGIAESAFKKLDAEDYWRIGLIGHEALEELDALTPEVTGPIRDELAKAPAPFCWFADQDAETVVRAFYLSAILAQHVSNWSLLLANIDPALKALSNIKPDILARAAPQLVEIDRRQAERDLDAVEQSLDRQAIQFLLLDQMKLAEPAGFAAAVEKEHYSTLIRSLALLMALDNLLSATPARDEQARIARALFPDGSGAGARFIDGRASITWSHLKEAYELAYDLGSILAEVAGLIKTLKVTKIEHLTFKFFREAWNEKRMPPSSGSTSITGRMRRPRKSAAARSTTWPTGEARSSTIVFAKAAANRSLVGLRMRSQ